ncbi:MAG: DUF2089 family protein [Thermoanaerobacteraceae bacterium]|nr:DUF2089 family protein [Thermoanaerobacteraceae bacterium]
MSIVVGNCPFCGEDLNITKLSCLNCGIVIEGKFELGFLNKLNYEQINFVVEFIRCRGNIKEMEKRLGVSNPTVRSKLYDIIDILTDRGTAIGEKMLSSNV